MLHDSFQASSEVDILLSLPRECWDPHTPPFYDEDKQSWQVFGYADVSRVLLDNAAYSYEWGFTDDHPSYDVMWAFDDPRHHDLRAIVSEPFRRVVLDRLESTVRALADELIDDILAAGSGTFELMSAFADQFAIRVICRVLGVELADAARFQAWTHEAATSSDMGKLPRQDDMRAYFAELLERRRAAPQVGLVDDLIAAQRNGYRIAGVPLRDRDLVGYLWGLLIAGSSTTATSFANLLLFLSQYDVLDRLRDEPALHRSAVEESLRWYPSFPTVLVRARQSVRIGDTSTQPGDFVTGWLTSANRDPDHFPNPDVFDVGREPNAHLGLGRGQRNCLGAPLARLELRVGLAAMLERLPGLRWQRELPFRRLHGPVDRVDEAHFAFDAGV